MFGAAYFGKHFDGAAYFGPGVTGTPTPTPTTTTQVGGGRRRPKYVLWEEPEKAPDLSQFIAPRKVRRAIERVLEDDLPDPTSAIEALRSELARLNVEYKPQYSQVLIRNHDKAIERLREMDDEDAIVLLFH